MVSGVPDPYIFFDRVGNGFLSATAPIALYLLSLKTITLQTSSTEEKTETPQLVRAFPFRVHCHRSANHSFEPPLAYNLPRVVVVLEERLSTSSAGKVIHFQGP